MSARRGALRTSILTLALAGLFLSSLGATTGGPFQAAPRRALVDQTYPAEYSIATLASRQHQALTVGLGTNGSYTLTLANLTANSSRVLGILPGGLAQYPLAAARAGRGYLLEIANFSSGVSEFERVSGAGSISVAHPPLGPALDWSFVFSNRSTLLASAPGLLVALNATTLSLRANYSGSLPPRLEVGTAWANGSRLYLAGSLENRTGASATYFGVLDTTTGRLTRPGRLVFHAPPTYAALSAVGEAGGAIYVGGGVTYENGPSAAFRIATVAGLLYRFDPATGAFVNVSRLLPASNASVRSVVPFERSLLIVSDAFSETQRTRWSSVELLALGPRGHVLRPVTSLLPSSFSPENITSVSASGGFVYLAGEDTNLSRAELVALRG